MPRVSSPTRDHMARRRRRRSTRSSPESIIAALLGLLLLGLAGRLMQAIATSPLLGVPGLVLVVIGIAAAMFLVARRRRLRARTLTDLLALTPTEFEQATASLLQELGYG